jgi:RIO-like serine/threonine protein kinase
MNQPFTRDDLRRKGAEKISGGRWANADLLLYTHTDGVWVVKDFMPCSPFIRQTWGAWMAARELRALVHLQGIPGIPADPFALDTYAFCYRFVPGTNLKYIRRTNPPGADFFLKLEQSVHQMHQRGIVHLDIRYMRNIVVSDTGDLLLLDFQTCLFLNYIPRFMHQFLKNIDISGVYKCWKRVSGKTIDPERLAFLKKMEKKRSLWVFKGYPLGTRASRR